MVIFGFNHYFTQGRTPPPRGNVLWHHPVPCSALIKWQSRVWGCTGRCPGLPRPRQPLPGGQEPVAADRSLVQDVTSNQATRNWQSTIHALRFAPGQLVRPLAPGTSTQHCQGPCTSKKPFSGWLALEKIIKRKKIALLQSRISVKEGFGTVPSYSNCTVSPTASNWFYFGCSVGF